MREIIFFFDIGLFALFARPGLAFFVSSSNKRSTREKKEEIKVVESGKKRPAKTTKPKTITDYLGVRKNIYIYLGTETKKVSLGFEPRLPEVLICERQNPVS